MVSATGLAWATAIGAAPRMMTPIAPTAATDLMPAEATACGAAADRSRSRQLAAAAGLLAGAETSAGARATARYPAVASSTIGIMLLGSVPRPPRNPRSSISTQSARQSTVKPIRTGRISRGRPDRNAAPVTASAATTNKLTANPCASSKAVKALTQADRKPGCGVWAIDAGHAGQRAGLAVRDALPEPPARPGLQDRHAEQEHAQPGQVSRRPSRRERQARSGSAISAPATA